MGLAVLSKNLGPTCLALITIMAASSGMASADLAGINLTEEQQRLLTANVKFNNQVTANSAESFGSAHVPAVPLIRLSLSAEQDLMRGNGFNLSASYQSWQVREDGMGFGTTFTTDFSLRAPVERCLDFRKDIRKNAQTGAKKMFDKYVIDGAVGFAIKW